MHPVLPGQEVMLPLQPLMFPLNRVQASVLLALLLPELAERRRRLRLELRERLPQEGDGGDRPTYGHEPCNASRNVI